MANYYYVRDSAGFTGTATGDGGRVATTPRTGSWNATASESYVSISAALGATTAPADGDYIIVAADHAHDYAAATTLTSTVTNNSNEVLNLVSVSTTNQDQYSAGGKETNSGGGAGADLGLAGSWAVSGMTFETNDNYLFSTNANQMYYGCTFQSLSNSGQYNLNQTGGSFWLIDCTFNAGAFTSQGLYVNSSNIVYLDYCTFSGDWDKGLFSGTGFATGGGALYFTGCDLTNVGAAGTDYIVEGVGGATGDEYLEATFERCQINSSVGGWLEEVPLTKIVSFVKATNSAATSAAAEYQFYYADAAGETEHSTSSYRDQSIAWPISGSKTSLVIDTATAAVASHGLPHSFDLPSRWAELSSATTDAVTFYLSSNTALDDNEVWIECIYPDGTNKHTPNRVTTRNTDILAAGTALTTDSSSTWTSGGSNKYKIKVDTSGDAGADCVPIMRIYVAVQATIYLDWYPELGT